MSANTLRQRHRALVLGTLRAHGALSRVEISRHLGVSFPTVTEVLNGFVAQDLVEVVGEGESSGGRRPILYGLRMDKLQAVGVNVDLHHISAVVSDLSGDVHAEAAVQFDLSDGQDAFVRTLHRAIDDVLAQMAKTDRLAGIGIALPVPMRRSRNRAIALLDTPQWGAVNVNDVLDDRFRLPVVVENRARAAAVGE